jgi:hypothetical protein
MRTEIEDAMGRLVALDRDNPAHAAGAGNVVACGDAAPIPPLPLLGGAVHPPLEKPSKLLTIFPTNLMTYWLTKLPHNKMSHIFVLFVSQKFVANQIGLPQTH